MRKALPFFLLGFLGVAGYAGAAENLDARLKAVKQQRAAYQRHMQQQAIAQRQQQMLQQAALRQQAAVAQQKAVYQAAIQQHQAQMMSQQQQAYQQATAQQGAQLQQQLTYQQALQQKAYNQALGAENYQMRQAQTAAFQNIFGPPQVAQTTTMAEVWQALEHDSHVWSSIMDEDAKEVIVVKFIQDLRKEGLYIRKSAVHYVQLIDQMSLTDPSMLDKPFKTVLQIVAIMEYDLDNGTDPDLLAKKVLGPQVYESNLKRLGKK